LGSPFQPVTFLPIVQRELRAAARRRNTYRVRWWAAVLGLGLTFLSLMVVSVSRGRGVGNPLFTLLTGYAFGMCLLAGVFLTSIALTEEKGQGTLGLLFLTDLKGYDVVLGKFLAHSLTAFYCLLALLPVTALPILLGGVVGGEFLRMALALANALFFSLAAGICVSAFMGESSRAMGNTLGLLLLLVAGLPVLHSVAAAAKISSVWLGLCRVSPAYPFSYSSEMLYLRHSGVYWGSLGASHVVAWGFLVAGSLRLPRTLREEPVTTRGPARRQRNLASARQTRLRASLLDRNPVLWLRWSELSFPWGAWLIALAWLVTAALLFVFGGVEAHMLLGEAARPFSFLFKVLFAVQACRFFVEARRNGSLELVLSTPVTDQQVIRGQIHALWRRFAWPLACLVGGMFGPLLVQLATLSVTHNFDPFARLLGGFMLSGAHVLRLAADLFAILWLGMALALTSKKPNMALALTVLFVLVLPAPLSFCWLDVLIDLIFIAWGVNKCQQNLRRLVAEQYQVPSSAPGTFAPASSTA
jgi:ABC-type transport system involved in multi-copper enzyme maturation permease subunit